MFVPSIVCVMLPRFELAVAAGGREALLEGPAALAPEPGREQLVGEVSRAAEAFGIHPGMRLGEALARCPRLALVPPDPVGVADDWERVVVRLESVGAAVEAGRPGLACFDARGLRRLHGGSLDGVVAAVRAAQRRPARIGAGPSRFCALAAAARARPRRTSIISRGSELAPEPVALLRFRDETAALPETLERLGVRTLGDLAALPRGAVSDRFGAVGLLAHDFAHGRDTPLVPRRPDERLEESLELEESASGAQLERGLGLLIDRLLARRERDGRTLRAVVVSATLVEGGTWRERVVFREPLADPSRMRLALGQRLGLLPAPAEALRLAVERFGPSHPSARALFDDGAAQRRDRLREAIRQVRAVAGPEGALRVLAIDPDSRVPERRAVLTPFEL
ncbi:MAG: protein ImuB [Solirubrobacteraceae bacterium]|nr:protein ImuB [Solirubrobacteraceae bacterium]